MSFCFRGEDSNPRLRFGLEAGPSLCAPTLFSLDLSTKPRGEKDFSLVVALLVKVDFVLEFPVNKTREAQSQLTFNPSTKVSVFLVHNLRLF